MYLECHTSGTLPAMPRLVELTDQDPNSGKPSRERWVEDSLGDGWLVRFRLEWTGFEHVVSELRVFYKPDIANLWGVPEDQVPLSLRGVPPAHIPAGGLTARRLRGIRFGPAHALAREALEESIASSFDAEGFRRVLEEARLAQRIALRPARRGHWTDADYVALAARYAAKVRDGVRHPVAELADETSYSPARIRQALKHARDRGWLTKTTRRRAGGTLTDEALAIARQEREER